MNERIRQLAVAAAPANSSIPQSEWNIPKEFIEKFAELIVRECAEIAKRNGCKPDPYSENYDAQVAVERKAQEIYDEIMCNFGVEL